MKINVRYDAWHANIQNRQQRPQAVVLTKQARPRAQYPHCRGSAFERVKPVMKLLHFTIWYWLDHDFNFVAMISDVIKRPFITAGFIAFVIMSLLALTSNQKAMRLLGGKWKMLHRFIYLIAILAIHLKSA